MSFQVQADKPNSKSSISLPSYPYPPIHTLLFIPSYSHPPIHTLLFIYDYVLIRGFPDSSVVKNPPARQKTQKTWVQSLDQEDPLEEGMATHSSILVWRILWTEEPGGLQCMGSQRVRHSWSDLAHTHVKCLDLVSAANIWTATIIATIWLPAFPIHVWAPQGQGPDLAHSAQVNWLFSQATSKSMTKLSSLFPGCFPHFPGCRMRIRTQQQAYSSRSENSSWIIEWQEDEIRWCCDSGGEGKVGDSTHP